MNHKITKFVEVDRNLWGEKYFENNLVVKKCESWVDFINQVSEVESFYKFPKDEDLLDRLHNVPLYRGHGDANWELKSTLERSVNYSGNVLQYYRLILAVHKHISTCGIQNLPKPTYDVETLKEELKKRTHLLPSLELLIFLRHLGFPSPLLDWSRSVYIAAFFAYQNHDLADNVAIYAFLEKCGKFTSSTSEKPDRMIQMRVVGEYLATHKRHFLQQSNYTICMSRDFNDNPVEFESYKLHLDNNGELFPEAIIVKFVLPKSERRVVLKELDQMNINAYSLYGTEEALMETLFNREKVFR